MTVGEAPDGTEADGLSVICACEMLACSRLTAANVERIDWANIFVDLQERWQMSTQQCSGVIFPVAVWTVCCGYLLFEDFDVEPLVEGLVFFLFAWKRSSSFLVIIPGSYSRT